MKINIPRLLIAALFVLTCSHALAQNPKDKYDISPEDWKTSSLPTPFGFIGSFGYPIVGGPNANMGFGDKIAFGIDAYYDAWSLGYHQTEHGAGFRISPRSISRDMASGWFFEIGSRTYSHFTSTYNSILDQSVNDTSRVSATTYVFGYYAEKAVNSATVSLMGGYGVNLGYAVGVGDDHFFIAEAEYDVGVRIPMAKNALSIYARIYGGGGFPDIDRPVASDSSDPKPHGFWGIKLTTQFALNFDNQ
ncbi:MAG: hypothetical protein Q8896_01260 [Bacteroidota bacterium]|nr:hypothetical protein [Bacteroidota bacterium]